MRRKDREITEPAKIREIIEASHSTRLRLIAALPMALAHATPTQARRVHAYYIAGIRQPEISRREGVHSSKVSVAIHRGLRNMRRCYDDLFQTE